MDPVFFAAGMLIYTLILVWLLRSAGQNNTLSHNHHPAGAARQVGRAPPTIERVFPGVEEPGNVQNLNRRMRQPSRSRSRSRAPSLVPPQTARSRSRTRAPSQPVRRPRSQTRECDASPAQVQVQAVPLLPTISGSSISPSTIPSVSSSSADPSGRRMTLPNQPVVEPPRISQFTAFREVQPIIREDTLSMSGSGKGKAPSLSASTIRGVSTSIPPSSVGTSTLAQNFTTLSLNSRASKTRSEKQSTPGPSHVKDEDNDYNPFVPRTPVSSASNPRRGGSPASGTSRRTSTPQRTPGARARTAFPIVARTQDGVAIRRCDRTVPQNNADPVVTRWYQSDEIADEMLWAAPDLTHDRELTLGDLYYHRLPLQSQFWLWSLEDGEKQWVEVKCGYMREDGRYLITTKVDHLPSWVQRDAFRRAQEWLDL
ncbi:hypothetical protein C8T65DRAFT_744059 [Cerioporus squamosus]|nr:hypothetical protein C8T65DRAFT_744059 [Cerioporus squamosus]